MSRIRCCVLALVAGVALGAGALPARAADVLPGTVLPDASQLIGFQQAVSRARALHAGQMPMRVKFEIERGVLVYRVELVTPGSRTGYRTELNATSGSVTRDRRQTIGTGPSREATVIQRAAGQFTVDFGQAAQIASTAIADSRPIDVRLDASNNRGIVYRVELIAGGVFRQVRVNPVTGEVVSISNDTSSGGNGSGGSSSGGSNSSGGNPTPRPTPTNPGRPTTSSPTNPVATLPSSARALVRVADALVSDQPGTVVEVEYKTVRRGSAIKAKSIDPSGTTQTEIEVNPATGATLKRETEAARASDASTLASWRGVLNGAEPIGFDAAMRAALGHVSGDVQGAEIELYAGRAIYEVKILTTSAIRSVKIDALTGQRWN